MPDDLDIQDYLNATSDAARRARSTSITLVVASVLVFSGLLNSLQHSWMLQRIHASNGMYTPYVVDKIGRPPDSRDPEAMKAYQTRYQEFYSALMRTYVDSSYVIRVPFFGFRVDANDLGLIGGVAFAVILVMLRFAISREVDNLKISFEEARALGQLQEFYTLLAMRQVFTIPASRHINRTPFLMLVPKLFCFAPLVVHAAVTAHDFLTVGVGSILSDTHTAILFICEVALLVAISVLTGMVVVRDVLMGRPMNGVWRLGRSRNGTCRRTTRFPSFR